MDIPPEVIAARDAIDQPLLDAGLITGTDFGVRDEDQPDPDDLALRVFVADENNVPDEVQAAVADFPFPVVVLQRSFTTTAAALPDTQRYRPLVGGVSVAASRFLASGLIHAGTLGAIVTDSSDSNITYGLSNHHVLCVDMGRQQGQEIVQPEPTPLGVIPGDPIGTLQAWAFPETTASGDVDAAIALLNVQTVPEIAEVGAVFGTVDPTHTMLVRKRGRTTGLTFGWINGILGNYNVDYPNLPPVTPPSTMRTMQNQIQVHIDFPMTLIFGESGDSGSVVLGDGDRVAGLYFASGYFAPGDPLKFGLFSPASAVENALGIRF